METMTGSIKMFFSTLIDKSLRKNWRLVLFVPLMYLIYGLATIMPLFGLIYNIEWITSLGFVIIFVLLIVFGFTGGLKLFTRIAVLENDKKAWLQWHSLFLVSTIVFDVLILLPISSWLTFQVYPDLRVYPLAWTLLSVSLFLYFANSLKEMLGMRIVNLRGDSVLGARAFAMLSRVMLQNAKRRGIDYLSNAIKMLDNSLSYEGIRIELLTRASLILDSFQLLNSEAHYEKLIDLSTAIENSLELENIINSIDKFLGKREAWHKKVSPTEHKRFIDILSKTLILCLTIITVAAALFSESLKNQISSLLLATPWQSIFMIIFVFAMFFFLMRSISLFLSRSFDLRDLAELATKERVSELKKG